MDYYISTIVQDSTFENVELKVRQKLQENGFGVVTEINMQTTFKNKLDVDFKPYKILGACNPGYAHKVLSKSDKMGVMLPCNVCIQQNDTNIEVFAVNPLVAMLPVQMPEIETFAREVYESLNNVIASI